jgi:hypothetical protein
LLEFIGDHEDALKELKKRSKGGQVTSIRLTQEEMVGLFKDTVACAVTIAETTFTDQMDEVCHYIFVVGGFGQCKALQKLLRERLEHRLTPPPDDAAAHLSDPILFPFNGGSAIVRGAALFGVHAELIPVRRCRFTLSQLCLIPYDPDLDEGHSTAKIGGRDWCRDGLKTIIGRGMMIGAFRPEPFDLEVRTPVRRFDRQGFEHYAPVRFYLSRSKSPRHHNPEKDAPLVNDRFFLIHFDGEGVGRIRVETSFDIHNEYTAKIVIRDLFTGKVVDEFTKHVPTEFCDEDEDSDGVEDLPVGHLVR